MNRFSDLLEEPVQTQTTSNRFSDLPVPQEETPKPALPTDRPLSRNELSAMGVTAQTNLQQRQVITDVLNRKTNELQSTQFNIIDPTDPLAKKLPVKQPKQINPEYVKQAEDTINKMTGPEFANFMSRVKVDPFGAGQFLTRHLTGKSGKEYGEAVDAVYQAISNVQSKTKITDWKKYPGLVGDIVKTVAEFAALPGGGGIGTTAAKFAAQTALQLPTVEEEQIPFEQAMSNRVKNMAKSAVTGIGVGALGKYIPNPIARVPIATGGFMGLTALEGGTPDQILESGITVLGFEAVGLAQRGLHKRAVEKAIEFNPKLKSADRQALENSMVQFAKTVNTPKEVKTKGSPLAENYKKVESLLQEAQTTKDPARRTEIGKSLESLDVEINVLSNLGDKNISELHAIADKFGVPIKKGLSKSAIINSLTGVKDLSLIEKTETGFRVKLPIADNKAGKGYEIHDFNNYSEALDFLSKNQKTPEPSGKPPTAPTIEAGKEGGQTPTEVKQPEIGQVEPVRQVPPPPSGQAAAVTPEKLAEAGKPLAAPTIKGKMEGIEPPTKPISPPEGGKAAEIIAYHGTSQEAAKSIEAKGFNPKITNGQFYGSGVYLSSDQTEAAKYGESVIPLKVKLDNPFILDMSKYRSVEEWYDEIQKDIDYPLKNDYGEAVTVHQTDLEGGKIAKLKTEAIEAAQAITDYLKDKGYDGVIVKEKGNPDEIVVFNPEQITKQAQRIEGKPAQAEKQPAEPVKPKIGTIAAKEAETQIPGNEIVKSNAKRAAGGFLTMFWDIPGPKQLRQGAESLYQDFVNRFSSIESTVKKAQKLGMKVKPGENAALRARGYLGMARKVESVLNDKTYLIRPDGKIITTGEGLKPILDSYDSSIKSFEKNRKIREQDFDDYLVAKRTIEDLQREPYEGAERNIVSPEEVSVAQKKLDVLNKKYGQDALAQIESHAQRLYQYQKRILHSLVDAGNISQALYDKIVKENQHYIPFDRVLDEEVFSGGVPVSKKRFTEARAPIRKIKGSKGLKAQPVMETVIKNTYKILEATERNQIAKSIAKLGEVLPNEISPVRIKMYPIKVDPKEILTVVKEFRSKTSKIMEDIKKTRTEGGENADISGPQQKLEKVVKDSLVHRGFSEGEAESFISQIKKQKPGEKPSAGTNTVETIRQVIKETQRIITSKEPVESTIFRASQFKPKGDVIEYFDNGHRKYIEVPENLYKSMTGLNEEGAGIMAKILSKPAHWLRVGATITPEFIVRNPLRDTWTAGMQTSFGFVPFVDQIGAIADILGKSKEYQDWNRSGGAYSGFVELSRPALNKAYKELTATTSTKLLKKLNILTDLQDISQLMEQATRLSVYKRAIGKGLSPVEAGFESREATVDFARRGAKMSNISSVVAFLNANIQGFDKTIRNSIKHPYSTAIKGALTITLPSLLLYLRNRDDEEYKEIPQWQKDLFWIVRLGDTHYRIPKPFIYGQVFGTLPERFFAYLDTKDTKAFDGLATSIIDAASPVGLNPVESMIPTAIKPMIENWANKSFFTERELVPDYKLEYPKSEQYGRYETKTAKKLGEWFNYSPAKIENLIQGYFGGTGKYALEGVDTLVSAIKKENSTGRPKELSDYPLVKGFVTRPAIGPTSESIADFYKNCDTILGSSAAYNALIKTGNVVKSERLLKNKPKLVLSTTLRKYQTALSDLSKSNDMIAQSNMTTNEKRERIKTNDRLRVELARQANELIEQFKSSSD
jgi:hypothetical protein